MNQHLKSLIALVGTLCALGLAPAQAEDNTSTIISGVSSNNAGANYVVGLTGSNNYLQIDSGGQLTGVNFAYIGSNTTANANSALVKGTDATGNPSLWYANNQFHIGSYGDSNSLTVVDRGSVVGQRVILGFNAGSDYNRALVSGTNSVLQATPSPNNNVVVGRYGSWNSLTTSNGGAVLGSLFSVGVNAGANYNSALVTGPGSVWTVNTECDVGAFGGSNSLTIADGGAVNALSSLVLGGPGAAATNNSVLVTGTNSVWSCFGVLYVGTSGTSNGLTIANGGKVVSGEGWIGVYAGANYNSVLVTGAGSAWTNDTGITVGSSGSTNSLTIASGGTVITMTNFNIGTGAGAVGNGVLVTGANSVLDVGGAAVIGTAVSGQANSLTVANGGLAKVRNVAIDGAGTQLNINAGLLKAQTDHLAFITAAPSSGNVYVQSGGAVIDSDINTIRVQAPLEADPASPGGGLTKIGNGTLELSATNTYTGPTTVGAGTFGGNCGLLTSSLLIKSGATVAPGAEGIGTLAVAGGVTNETGSTTIMEITSDSNATDRLISSNNIALNGTLVVTNLGTAAFTNAQEFVLYQSLVGISGSFSATNLPTLSDPNLAWRWTLTPVSLPATPVATLTLSVTSVVTATPTNITCSYNSGVLDLTWPGSHLGWYAQSNAVSVADTNYWFDIPGSELVTNLSINISPSQPSVFYRLRYP
jgi:autotransporter-associated beta strand protein/T5SS/PEP-CTERM-associated repeat protein